MDLHYSQTVVKANATAFVFYYLMDLHYSQTEPSFLKRYAQFYYLMDLHYSQTRVAAGAAAVSFTTLWIYTILKRRQVY